MTNWFRRMLIRLGRAMPFIVCFVVCIHYVESLVALLTDSYIRYDGVVILDTPVSFFVGSFFEYNIQLLFVLFVISFAVETCVYNKVSCVYLFFNLLEKSCFGYDMDVALISAVAVANAVASGFLSYRGLVLYTAKN